MKQKIYRSVFWVGFLSVIAVAIVPLKGNLHKVTLDVVSFKLHLDQVLHVVVYFLICMYFLTGQYLGLKLFRDDSFLKFLIVVVVLATVTEAVQLFVPMRVFNFFDWIANVVGIVVGVVVIWLFGTRRKAVGSRQKKEGGRRLAVGRRKKAVGSRQKKEGGRL